MSTYVMKADLHVHFTYLFQSTIDNIADSSDLFHLPNPVHSVKRLVLKHGIPLRFHEKDVVCGGECQSGKSQFQITSDFLC